MGLKKEEKKRKKLKERNQSDHEDGTKKRKVTKTASVQAVKDLAHGLMKKRSNMNPALLKEITRNATFVRPKFMSKTDRINLLKLKKRDRKDRKKKVVKSELKNRDEFFRSARYDRGEEREKRERTAKPDLEKELEMKARLQDREMRQKAREYARKQEKVDKELQLIWNDYMGKADKRKGQFLPPSMKFKFDFDWKASEDTSEALNDLYMNKAPVAFRFGRGTVAGVDEEEQLKANKTTWETLLSNRKTRFQSEEDKKIFRAGKKAIKKKAKLLRKKKEMLSRHWSEKELEDMTQRDWRILKEDFRITSKFGGRLPNPIRFWGESTLPEKILDAVKKAKYRKPSPIQRMAIPVGLQNRDCVGIAETGSGKTAAFLLPMLVYLMRQPKITKDTASDGPQALILAPTRELAYQIEGESKRFSVNLPIRSMTIVGGIHIEDQGFMLRDGVECIIATPGRLNDCLDRRYIVLVQCNYVVLDEADLMIDMGFEPQVTSILEAMPSSNLRPVDETEEKEGRLYRQTFMFSATMPPAVEKLTRKFLRNPVYIEIGDKTKGAENVTQTVRWVKEVEKRKQLEAFLPTVDPPCMIFCNTKKAADALAKYFKTQGLKTGALHGGKNQRTRTEMMNSFRKKEIDFLVCTNVAGRGIDVEDVNWVINFDMPGSIDSYMHRIGRTGRCGKTGCALTFVTEGDHEVFYDLKNLLLKSDTSVPHELMSHEASKRDPRDPLARKARTKIQYIKMD